MSIIILSREAAEQFQNKINLFYGLRRRSFPWRNTTDRYAVMVSEIMLQQTQADRVISKFTAWMEHFPDLEALAAAPLRDVLARWSGLGYNSRGQRLQHCAQIIMDQFDGEVPASPEVLKRLPGIGDYTCRSIPVFADNLDVAAVDTNIRRIIIHEFDLPVDTPKPEIQRIAEQLLPLGHSREWHNALMDYGALYLTSRSTGIPPLTKQSTFQHSRRWYRGKLIRELLDSEVIALEEIETKYAGCPWNLDDIIGGLVKEGLVEYGTSTMCSFTRVLKIKGC